MNPQPTLPLGPAPFHRQSLAAHFKKFAKGLYWHSTRGSEVYPSDKDAMRPAGDMGI
jgi:hypothetical protein